MFRVSSNLLNFTITSSPIRVQSVPSTTAAGVGTDIVVTVLSTILGSFSTFIDICMCMYGCIIMSASAYYHCRHVYQDRDDSQCCSCSRRTQYCWYRSGYTHQCSRHIHQHLKLNKAKLISLTSVIVYGIS